MRTVKLTIEYDGTLYHGWQVQPGLITIQGMLQDSLARLLGHKVCVYGAGRTDSGVHAKGQSAHFRTSSGLSPDVIMRALNSLLPDDIVIQKAEEMHPSFHAQFDAREKEYRYNIMYQSVPSVFYRRYALHVPVPLDVDEMRESLAEVEGTHDFFPLSTASEEKENTVRTITRAELALEEPFLIISIRGEGFLHKMVRRIVGTLLEVGKGKMPAGQMSQILQTRDKSLAGPSAPPHGLFLMSVQY
ncbi:MAG: tRNA pseudouridine(38-40) synthase TruA [bacterium]